MADIIIVGGGPIGGALACSLAEKGLEVAVVDQSDPAFLSVKDSRSFALSHSTFQLLSTCGIWQTLEEVTPIKTIHTSDSVLPSWVIYDEKEVKKGPLGYVVDSAILKSKILEKAHSLKNISFHFSSSVVHFEAFPGHVLVKTNKGEILKAPLCIAADGKSSPLRTWAQIPLMRWAYDQVAIVCTMAHSLPHENRAFEHFLPFGPLAFVPRPGNESGLVWSVQKEKAEILLNLSPEDFSEEVYSSFGPSLGAFSLMNQRKSYPLDVCLPKRLIHHRLALVGDAAHTFHPVAGQGLNVGFRDVIVLSNVLSEGFSLGLDLGSSTLLHRYQRQRRTDILSMTLLTDGLVRVFSTQNRFLARARSFGFAAVKHCTPLRHMMIHHAMGQMK